MTDWIANRSVTDYKNSIVLFTLAPSDTLTAVRGVRIDLQGPNSSFAVMADDTRLRVNDYAFIMTSGSSVVSTGDNVVVDNVRGFIMSVFGYALELSGSNNRITNSGSIEAFSMGKGAITSGGGSTITNLSLIRADYRGDNIGIDLDGGGNTIVNSNIYAATMGGAKAVNIVGGNNHIQNNGAFKSWTGTTIHLQNSVAGETNLIENGGNIIQYEKLVNDDPTAVAILSEGEADDTLINGTKGWGSIDGIVDLGGGNDTVHNNAHLYGDLVLGAGDDHVLNRAGKTLHNDVDFGSGEDRLVNDGTVLGNVLTGAGADSVANSGTIAGSIDLGSGADEYDGTASATASIVFGGSGDDTMRGGSGSDEFRGGAGADLMSGGGGNDFFAFDTKLAWSKGDRIVDFETGDRILLDSKIFQGLEAGVLDAAAFAIGSKARTSETRILYNPENGALLFDADGAGGAAAAKFATIENLPALTASHILVI